MHFHFIIRSDTQSNDNFEYYADNLELGFDVTESTNPYLIVLFGEFNAHT